jgi:hypothetical protein
MYMIKFFAWNLLIQHFVLQLYYFKKIIIWLQFFAPKFNKSPLKKKI